MSGNLFAGLPSAPETDERFELLHAGAGVQIERIVSTGQCSPPGFWYDQPDDEWVVLLSGSAQLRLADEAEPRALRPGDWVFIPARARHRVEATDPEQVSVWLAVHLPAKTA